MGPRQRRPLLGVRLEPGKLIALSLLAQRADKRSEKLNIAISSRIEQHEDAPVAHVSGKGRLFRSFGHRLADDKL